MGHTCTYLVNIVSHPVLIGRALIRTKPFTSSLHYSRELSSGAKIETTENARGDRERPPPWVNQSRVYMRCDRLRIFQPLIFRSACLGKEALRTKPHTQARRVATEVWIILHGNKRRIKNVAREARATLQADTAGVSVHDVTLRGWRRCCKTSRYRRIDSSTPTVTLLIARLLNSKRAAGVPKLPNTA